MCIAAAIAGAAVVGAGASVYSANKAAGAQQSAAQSAQNTQLGMYQQTAGNLAPYRQAGNAADARLAGLYGLGGNVPNTAAMTAALENTPGYQFQMSQGTQAIDRSAASQGLLNSGATGKALTQYGQGLAQSTAWQPYVSQLDQLASQGENAAAMTGNAATLTGQGVAQAQVYGGNAAAAGAVGTGSAINNGIGQGVGLYGLYQGGYFGSPNGNAYNYNLNQMANAGGVSGNLTYAQQVQAGF